MDGSRASAVGTGCSPSIVPERAPAAATWTDLKLEEDFPLSRPGRQNPAASRLQALPASTEPWTPSTRIIKNPQTIVPIAAPRVFSVYSRLTAETGAPARLTEATIKGKVAPINKVGARTSPSTAEKTITAREKPVRLPPMINRSRK